MANKGSNKITLLDKPLSKGKSDVLMSELFTNK